MEKNVLLTKDELQIPCKLTQPDFGDIRRVILGVHGLGGSTMDEIQVGIAEEMALFGAATVRFDFPAHGENPMGSEGFTLQNCRDTLLTAARWAKERFPQVEDLCIFASGFGAYMTLLVLEKLLELPGRIKLVIQTPSLLLHETILAMRNISQPTFQALDKITFNAPRPFDVTYSFFLEAQSNIVLTTHPIPMLILQGEADDYIRMGHIQNFRRINEQSKLVVIPGTSHRFLEEGAWDMVLDLTRDWFEFEQVLCCDWE